jgi:hypothetical protein
MVLKPKQIVENIHKIGLQAHTSQAVATIGYIRHHLSNDIRQASTYHVAALQAFTEYTELRASLAARTVISNAPEFDQHSSVFTEW